MCCLPIDPRYGQACNLESVVRKSETEMSTAKLDVPMRFEVLYESDIWIGDSGASSHSTNNKTGAENAILGINKYTRSKSSDHDRKFQRTFCQ